MTEIGSWLVDWGMSFGFCAYLSQYGPAEIPHSYYGAAFFVLTGTIIIGVFA